MGADLRSTTCKRERQISVFSMIVQTGHDASGVLSRKTDHSRDRRTVMAVLVSQNLSHPNVTTKVSVDAPQNDLGDANIRKLPWGF